MGRMLSSRWASTTTRTPTWLRRRLTQPRPPSPPRHLLFNPRTTSRCPPSTWGASTSQVGTFLHLQATTWKPTRPQVAEGGEEEGITFPTTTGRRRCPSTSRTSPPGIRTPCPPPLPPDSPRGSPTSPSSPISAPASTTSTHQRNSVIELYSITLSILCIYSPPTIATFDDHPSCNFYVFGKFCN